MLKAAGFPKSNIPLILAVVLALGFSVAQGSGLRFEDEQDYYRLATNIAHHGMFSVDGISPSGFRQPGWPVILAPFLFCGANPLILRFVNVAIFACSIILGRRLVAVAYGEAAAPIFAWLCCAYPLLAYTAGTLYPQSLAATLLIASLLLTVSERQSPTKSTACGLVLGFLTLTVSTFLVPAVCISFYPALSKARNGFRSSALTLVAFGCVVAPWIARNQLVVHEPTLSTNMGLNLILGNSDRTGPNTGVNVNIPQYAEVTRLRMTEAQTDKYLRSEAMDWIKTHPARATELFAEKFANFFGYKLDLATKGANGANHKSEIVIFLGYYSLIAFAGVNLVLKGLRPYSKFDLLLIAIYVLFGLASAVFFTRIRFRAPIDMVLIVLASRNLSQLLFEKGNIRR